MAAPVYSNFIDNGVVKQIIQNADGTWSEVVVIGSDSPGGGGSGSSSAATPLASAGPGQYNLSVTAVANLTPPSGAVLAEICVEGGAVRYRDDGVAPTATTGILVQDGGAFQYSGNLADIQFIAVGGTTTVISASYYSNAVSNYVTAGAGQYNLSVTAAVALTPPAGALFAQISVEGGAVRYRDDGSQPTATIGIPVLDGGAFQYYGNLSAISFIAQAGTTTVISVSYYKS